MHGQYLDGVLDLLLEIPRDVIAVCNVSDARQRHTGCEGLCETGQPAQETMIRSFISQVCRNNGCLHKRDF